MANSNSIILKPVNVKADVATVLGVSNYSVGYLCANTHGKINPWARYKPVKYASATPDRSDTWWKSTDSNCGLTFPSLVKGDIEVESFDAQSHIVFVTGEVVQKGGYNGTE